MKFMNRSVAVLAVCVLTAPALADDAKDAKSDRGPEFRKKLLEKFDKDGDGKLSEKERAAARAEFEKRRKQAGGKARIDREEILKKFDKNENGKIDPDERPALIEHFKKLRGQQGTDRPVGDRFKEAIKRFDKDGDGKLNEAERKAAREFFQKQGGQAGARFREMVKKFDKDGDGKLNEEERAALQKFIKENRGKGGVRPRPDAAGDRPKPARDRLNKEEVLKRFDKNGDGKIDADERKAALEARKAKKDAE